MKHRLGPSQTQCNFPSQEVLWVWWGCKCLEGDPGRQEGRVEPGFNTLPSSEFR